MKIWMTFTLITSAIWVLFLTLFLDISIADLDGWFEALIAFITLPAIFLSLRQSQKQQKIETGFYQLNSQLEIINHLNNNFTHHGDKIYYFLTEKCNLTPTITREYWEQNNDQNDIFAYLNIAFLQNQPKQDAPDKAWLKPSIAAITSKSRYGIHPSIKRFCQEVASLELILADLERDVGQKHFTNIRGHDVMKVYQKFKQLLGQSD